MWAVGPTITGTITLSISARDRTCGLLGVFSYSYEWWRFSSEEEGPLAGAACSFWNHSIWSVGGLRRDSNPGPQAFCSSALTNWATKILWEVWPLTENSKELTQLTLGLLDTVVGKFDDKAQRRFLGRRGDNLNKITVDIAFTRTCIEYVYSAAYILQLTTCIN